MHEIRYSEGRIFHRWENTSEESVGGVFELLFLDNDQLDTQLLCYTLRLL